MPSGFLSSEQVAGYGRYAAKRPSREVLDRFFFLDDADRELAVKHRGDHNRLGFSVQLVTVRHVGRFLPDPLDVPGVVAGYVAEQIGVAESFVDRGDVDYGFAADGELRVATALDDQDYSAIVLLHTPSRYPGGGRRVPHPAGGKITMSRNDEQPAGAGRHAMSGRDRDGEQLEALLAEHDAILAQEPVRVSARQRLIEIQDECFAILREQDAGRRG